MERGAAVRNVVTNVLEGGVSAATTPGDTAAAGRG